MHFTLSGIVFCLIIIRTMGVSHAVEGMAPLSDKLKQSPMDWSKPVVSRGFGDATVNSAEEKTWLDQYKSGQVLYFFGDYKKAAEKWQPLLKHNFGLAQASMGWLYQMGLGVEQDTKKAYALYLSAATQENAVAQNNLGVMYERGIEVKKDLTMARSWYEKSAKNAYRFAQFNYANLLFDGIGGEKNTQQAIMWYKKAAAQNVEQAIAKLASLNEEIKTK